MTRPHKPTDENRKLVETMTAVGIPQESIARCIDGGIDVKTLYKYYREELDTAATRADAKVAGTLFNKAINGDTAAAIFWAKTRMGWREQRDVNVNNTGTITHQHQGLSDLVRFFDEEEAIGTDETPKGVVSR